MLICCRFADCDRLRSRCCARCETPTAQGLCKIIFSVLTWSSCAKAPVSQLVEETASKSVQCGFESHRGHRINEQPRLEISSRGFFFETHLAHVSLRGSSVPCHPPDCRLSPRPRHACQDRCAPNVVLPLDVRLICRNAYAIIYRGFRHAFPCAGTRRCRLL